MIRDSGSQDKLIPISKILVQDSAIRCSVEEGSDIGKDVSKIIGQFSDGKYADAIGSIINSVSSALFG